jgi:hypothetical protein
MDENKILNLKDITSLKLLQDILLLISIWYQVLCRKQLDCNLMIWNRMWYCKNYPFSKEIYRDLCRYMDNFLEHHPWTRIKTIHSIPYIAI